MKKLIIILSTISTLSYADCMFKIINYTDSEFSAKIGFYNEKSEIVLVNPADSTIIKMTSKYECNSSTSSGIGVSYISFIKDPNGAGANYSAENKSINIMGRYTGSANGREVNSDNGKKFWLNATGDAITDEKFEVKLNFTSRPNSFFGGTP
ncbi:MAG: hypothetical protein PHC75_04080 [Burkholderiales bacterium]|nr:hypothetical protein [Burkholderiales bacterium]